jgi:outer membrane protein assembly factor BamD
MKEPAVRARRRAARAPSTLLLALLAGLGACGGPRVPLPKTDKRLEFVQGRTRFAHRDWIEAQQHFKRFLDSSPGEAQADSAQLLVGQCLFNEKSYAEAAVEFAILGREYPRSDLLDDAAYAECLCYFEQMRPAQLDPTFAARARTCLNEFLLRYPDATQREDAEKHLGRIADLLAEKELRLGMMFCKMKRPAAALVYLQEILDEYPSSKSAPQALLWIGRSDELLDKPAEAASAFRKLLEVFPKDPAANEARTRLRDLLVRHPELSAVSEGAPPARP